MPGYPLAHLINEFLDKMITKNPLYSPSGPPDFTDEQISMMTSTFTDIGTAIHNHILSWYVMNDQPFPDEMVKVNSLDPTSGYLEDKIDGITLRINPTNLRAEVYNIPQATADRIGGIKLSDNPATCLTLKVDGLYVNTRQNLFDSNSNVEIPTVRAVRDYVAQTIVNINGGTGLGDMLRNIYDIDLNGIVDNSERLGGQLPAYYLDYNNLTNVPGSIDKYNFYEDLQINKNSLLNPVIHNLPGTPSGAVQGQIFFNTNTKRLMFYDNTSWLPCYSDIDNFITLTEEATIAADDFVVIYDSSVSAYRRMRRSNFISGLGAGIANAYDKITDGTTTGTASSNDTIRFRAGTGLTIAIGSNDVTYGDNVLYGINLDNLTAVTSVVDADTIIINITGTGDRKITWANFKTELQTDKFVKGPASSTNGYIPTWSGTAANALATGYSVDSTLSALSTAIPNSAAVKTYVDAAIGGNFWSQSSGYLSPITASNLISLGTSSGITFGDNDTYIKQLTDDVLTIGVNNNPNIVLYSGYSLFSNSYIQVNKASAGYLAQGILVNGNYDIGISNNTPTIGYVYNGIGTGFKSIIAEGKIGLHLERSGVMTTYGTNAFIKLDHLITSSSFSTSLDFISIIDQTPSSILNQTKVLTVVCGTAPADYVERLKLQPRVANFPNSIAYLFDTTVNLTNTNTYLISVRNQGNVKFSIDKSGNVTIPTGTNYYIGTTPVGITINGFSNNAILTCSATTGELDADTTLTYDSTQHLLYQSYGSAADGRAIHTIVGGNTQTAGISELSLYNADRYLKLSHYSASSTETLFGIAMAGNTAIHNNSGDMYIRSGGKTIISSSTIPTALTLSDYGIKVTDSIITYAPVLKLSVVSSALNNGLGIEQFSTNASAYPQIVFLTSQNGTVGTFTQTPDGRILGSIDVGSVNTLSQRCNGIQLRFTQQGDPKSTANSVNMTLATINTTETVPINRFRWYPNGDFKATGTILGNTTITSDVRLKRDFSDILDPLFKVKSLKGRKFRYIQQIQQNQDYHLGLVAQEVEKVLPFLVTEHRVLEMEDREYKMVNYSELIPLLIEAIKELSSQVETLTNRTI